MQLRSLIGQRFGRLTVQKRAPNSACGRTMWVCRCGCGQEKIVDGAQLISGKTRSCGCLRKEIAKERATRHGKVLTQAYVSYKNAKSRCTNPNNPEFDNYGGRGIRFLYTSFEQFYTELGECPPGLTIGRIDGDDHYRPGNCQWETRQEQANKTRRNRRVAAFRQTKNLIQWARLFWIDDTTLAARLDSGLSPERALLDQGEMKNRIIVSNAPFEERAEWMRRFFASADPATRRNNRCAYFKAVWNAMDAVPTRRSAMTTAALGHIRDHKLV
jgi:hypothetical protein